MRKTVLLLLAVCVGIATDASGQSQRVRREPRVYLVLSDGIALSGGGQTIGNSNGLSQYMRISGVLGMTDSHGLEVSAIRLQEIIPVNKSVDDPAATDPHADGLILSYASITRQRGGGFPAVLSFGGGVLRRPTNDPEVDRETWGLQVGIESDMYRPRVDWADLSAGLRLLMMPGNERRYLYNIAITVGIRIG
jgi:hypothetical protein